MRKFFASPTKTSKNRRHRTPSSNVSSHNNGLDALDPGAPEHSRLLRVPLTRRPQRSDGDGDSLRNAAPPTRPVHIPRPAADRLHRQAAMVVHAAARKGALQPAVQLQETRVPRERGPQGPRPVLRPHARRRRRQGALRRDQVAGRHAQELRPGPERV